MKFTHPRSQSISDATKQSQHVAIRFTWSCQFLKLMKQIAKRLASIITPNHGLTVTRYEPSCAYVVTLVGSAYWNTV